MVNRIKSFELFASITSKQSNNEYEIVDLQYYPKSNDDDGVSVVQNLIPFCFPSFANNHHTHEKDDRDPIYHEFVLTDEQGVNRYVSCLKSSKHFGEEERVITALCLISLQPRWNLMKKSIFSIFYTASDEHSDTETLIYELISSMVEPLPGVSLKFQLPKIPEIAESRDIQQCRVDFQIAQIMQTISVPVFLTILTHTLFEKSIFIMSKSCTLITRTFESVLALLSPFEWRMVYIPVIPPQLQDLLQAPTPYLMGGHSSWAESIDPAMFTSDDDDNQTGKGPAFSMINLDTYETALAQLPSAIPEYQSLVKQLREALNIEVDSFDIYEHPDNKEDLKNNHVIQKIFSTWFLDLLGDFIDYYKEDGRFDEKRWILSKPETNHGFFKTLAKTYIFQHFVESKRYLSLSSVVPKTEFDMHLAAQAAGNLNVKSKSHQRASTFGQQMPVAKLKDLSLFRRVLLALDDASEILVDFSGVNNRPVERSDHSQMIDFDRLSEIRSNKAISGIIEKLKILSVSPKTHWLQARCLALSDKPSDQKAAWDLFISVWEELCNRGQKNDRRIELIVKEMSEIMSQVSEKEDQKSLFDNMDEKLKISIQKTMGVLEQENKKSANRIKQVDETFMDRLVLNCVPSMASHVIDSIESLDDDSLIQEHDLDCDSKALLCAPVKLSQTLCDMMISMYQIISSNPFGDSAQYTFVGAIGGSMNELSETPTAIQKKKKTTSKIPQKEREFAETHFILNDHTKIRMIKKMPNYVENFRKKIVLLQLIKPEDLQSDEEKLAFWLNVRNTLLLHAYVEFGFPMNFAHRMSFTEQKPVYLIGGFYFSVNDITFGILRTGLPLPAHVAPKTSISAGSTNILPISGDSGLTLVNVTATKHSSVESPIDDDGTGASRKNITQLKFNKNDPRYKFRLSQPCRLISFALVDGSKETNHIRSFRRDNVLSDLYKESLAFLNRRIDVNKKIISDGPKSESTFSFKWSASKKRQILLPQFLNWYIKDFIPTTDFNFALPLLYQLFPTAAFSKFLREEGIVRFGYFEEQDNLVRIALSYYKPEFEEDLQRRLSQTIIDWEKLIVTLRESKVEFELKFPLILSDEQ